MAGSSSTTQRRSRVVASLTKEEVQHKRDIDRKAQRALRQRTKDCISSLEQENARMRESFRSREAELEHQIQVLRDHNQTLAHSLGSILDLASTTLGVSGDGSVTTDESILEVQPHGESRLRSMSSPSVAHSMPTAPAGDHGRPPAAGFNNEQHAREKAVLSCTDNDVPSLSSVQDSTNGLTYVMSHPGMTQSGHAVLVSPPATAESLSTHYPAAERRPQNYHSEDRPDGVSGYQASVASPLVARQTQRVDETMYELNSGLPLGHANEDLSQNSGVVAMPTPSSIATVGRASVTEVGQEYSNYAVFTVVPPFVSSVCPLDDILHNFLGSRRAMLADGIPTEAVVGPTRPSLKKLRNPEQQDSLHALEELMSDVLSTYFQVKMPQKMAFFWVMNQTMRWMISRTKESYEYMPSWLRPTATQITVPHAIWITNIPWPGVRDLLVEHPKDYPYEAVGKWYTGHVSVNWNFDTLDAIDEVGGAERVHSIFEKHLRNLKNWTVSPAFLERFPAIAPLIHG